MHVNPHLTLLLMFVLVSCHTEPAEQTHLLEENRQLRAKLKAMEETELQRAWSKSRDTSPVTLANTETFRLQSADEQRRPYLIKVGYPRGYATNDASYPVLYVIDAETNFGGVHYIVQRLTKDRLIPEILVVGIAYDTDYERFYKLRETDLPPVIGAGNTLADPASTSKGAQGFSRFVRNQLIPEIEDRYRVIPEDRAIYGHSYGGLYGTYTLLYEPDLFDKYLILSPSLWWGNRQTGTNLLPQLAKTILVTETNARVYMASGELEPRIDDLQTEFVMNIRPRLPESLTIEAVVLANETHRTIFGPAFTSGLRYLYSH